MPKKEKRNLLILVIGAVILIVLMVMLMGKKEEQNPVGENEAPKEEFVQTLDDGTRLNTSTKLQETKKIEGLEISNFQVTAKNNATQLLGTIKNVSSSKQGNFLANVKVVDKQGKELTTVQVLIPEIEPGASTQLISSATFDYANAYDFSISRVK